MAAPKEKLEEEEFTTDTGPAKRGSGRPTRQSRRTGRYAVARPGMKGPLGRKSEAVVVVEDADEDFEEEAAATVGDIGERPSFPGLV